MTNIIGTPIPSRSSSPSPAHSRASPGTRQSRRERPTSRALVWRREPVPSANASGTIKTPSSSRLESPWASSVINPRWLSTRAARISRTTATVPGGTNHSRMVGMPRLSTSQRIRHENQGGGNARRPLRHIPDRRGTASRAPDIARATSETYRCEVNRMTRPTTERRALGCVSRQLGGLGQLVARSSKPAHSEP